MKKNIIFDLDGTLWNTVSETQFVWQEILRKYNMSISYKEIEEIMGLTREEIIFKLFPNDYLLGEKFIDECQKNENIFFEKNGGKIYLDTIETIKKLAHNNCLFIVSNCQDGYIDAFLNYYNLGKYFVDFESSGKTKLSKADNIRLIINRNKLNNAIYVGDTEKDYNSAKANNLKFVWAKYGFGKCNNFDYCINNISELPIVLQKIDF